MYCFLLLQFINQHQGSSTTTNKAQTKLAERMLEVSRHMSSQLMNCLFSANAEIQLEAARVLGMCIPYIYIYIISNHNSILITNTVICIYSIMNR